MNPELRRALFSVSDQSIVVRRFARIMLGRGCIASVCGIAALVKPEGMLLVAMLLTSAVLAVSGAYEIGLSLRNRRDNRAWPLAAGDGVACLAMALLTATISAIPLQSTVLLSALWLAACGMAALLLAFAVWPMRRTRLALLAWAITQLALGLVAMVREPGLLMLLYVGASYSIGFGVFQMVSSIWMLRVAVPRFEPTIQQGWGWSEGERAHQAAAASLSHRRGTIESGTGIGGPEG